MSNLVDKAEKLRIHLAGTKDEETFSRVGQLYKQARNVSLLDSLKENDGVKFIVDRFSRDVKEINEILITSGSQELNDRQRDRLIDKKDLLVNFIKMFTDNEKHLESLEKELDYQLEGFNEEE